jgi:hypothetical protein
LVRSTIAYYLPLEISISELDAHAIHGAYTWSTFNTRVELSPANRVAGQEKIIFSLGAQPGDKNFLQTHGVYLC